MIRSAACAASRLLLPPVSDSMSLCSTSWRPVSCGRTEKILPCVAASQHACSGAPNLSHVIRMSSR